MRTLTEIHRVLRLLSANPQDPVLPTATIHRVFLAQAEALCAEFPAGLSLVVQPTGEPGLTAQLRADDGSELSIWAASAPTAVVVGAPRRLVKVFPATPDLEATVAEAIDLFRAFFTGTAAVTERYAGTRWYRRAIVWNTTDSIRVVAHDWRIPWNLFARRSGRAYRGRRSSIPRIT